MIGKRYIQFLSFTITTWLVFFVSFQVTLSLILQDFDNLSDALLFLLIVSFPSAFLSGFLIETLDYIILDYKLFRNAYFTKIFIKSILHVSIFLFIVYKVAYFFVDIALYYGIKPINAFTYVFTTNSGLILLIVYSYLISFLINFLRQINEQLGHKTLLFFLIGKYRKPVEDNRIFLFLDLNDSTTLAEEMGHYQYSSLIQDCFKDLTTLIISHKAEVYQYVGDQVVLHWKNTPENKSHMIALFFDFEDELKKRKMYYMSKYNIQPSFKAGADIGLVMISEVGEIKKMIAYHGDVLNVAARIEGLCNKMKKSFLVSEHLFDSGFTTSVDINITYIAQKLLKGKREKLNVYSIERFLH
ncbi:adenylate/guanylate cyclase domain-containing protein [Rapidithrix thailandica]|uniref:Adenylate/guanylate cyclase domain-containing protein n=1 Tax=Rapidithrix thailandica TaxID=413964 RepID=A0AAW9RYQ9_9BACT